MKLCASKSLPGSLLDFTSAAFAPLVAGPLEIDAGIGRLISSSTCLPKDLDYLCSFF